MFDDDSASAGAFPLFSTFKSLQKPSSSKLVYNFGLSSSSLEQEEEKLIQIVNKVQDNQGNEIKTTPPQSNKTETNPSPSEPDEDNGDDENDDKSKSSN